jgi:hypothetical protein
MFGQNIITLTLTKPQAVQNPKCNGKKKRTGMNKSNAALNCSNKRKYLPVKY